MNPNANPMWSPDQVPCSGTFWPPRSATPVNRVPGIQNTVSWQVQGCRWTHIILDQDSPSCKDRQSCREVPLGTYLEESFLESKCATRNMLLCCLWDSDSFSTLSSFFRGRINMQYLKKPHLKFSIRRNQDQRSRLANQWSQDRACIGQVKENQVPWVQMVLLIPAGYIHSSCCYHSWMFGQTILPALLVSEADRL